MTLLKEQDNTPFPYASIMIVLGIIGIVFGFGSLNGAIDEGLLTSKEVTVLKGPILIPGAKRSPAQYLIFTNEYLSPFQITGTAYSIVKRNGGLQQIQMNDRLQVIFLNERQNRLDNPIAPVQVFGLTDSRREYFSPGILVAEEDKSSNTILICSSALLITGLVMKLRRATVRFRRGG
jgi:hypothetical protein